MHGYVNELTLEDTSVDQNTVSFYTDLGLFATRIGSTLHLYSTDTTRIKSFETELKLGISKTEYDSLLHKKKIMIMDDGRCTACGTTGMTVIIEPVNFGQGISLAVLTSGGDSPGMNSAVRSIVRYSLKNQIKVFGVYRGFEGLIEGDIRRLEWDNETHLSGESGTYLMSARSKDFRTREGRKEAAFNLIIRNIDVLVVIGGEGSMKGALVLKDEFVEHHKELIAEGRLTSYNTKRVQEGEHQENSGYSMSTPLQSSFEKEDTKYKGYDETGDSEWDLERIRGIKIIGLPGTIDNDITGTDLTIGCDTALTRVAEVAKKLISTMRSHMRVFVVQCMGRMCGWITLMAGFSLGVEYIFIPEAPDNNWREEMMWSIRTACYNNKPNIFVFMSEGALDGDGNNIELKDIVSVIEQDGMEVREFVIGHIQRGGMTSARDRFLGTILGLKAVEYAIEGAEDAMMIGYVNEKAKAVDLREVVEASREIRGFYEQKRYSDVMSRRDSNFQEIYRMYQSQRLKLNSTFYREVPQQRCPVKRMHARAERKLDRAVVSNVSSLLAVKSKLRIGVLAVGQTTAGMNAIVDGLVQYGLCEGIDVLYFLNGHEGILNMNIRRAEIFEFSIAQEESGVVIGTSEKDIDYDETLKKIEEYELDYIVIVGGTVSLKFAEKSNKVFIIPTTAANNFPGVSLSIGSETALNAIAIWAETCRMSATPLEKTVYLLDVGGGMCGYLSAIGGICCSAFETINPEFNKMEELLLISRRIKQDARQGSLIIIRNEETFGKVPTESLCQLLCSGSNVEYRCNTLSNIQGGLMPSMIDRLYAKMTAFKVIEAVIDRKEGCIVGIRKGAAVLIDIENALSAYDKAKDTVKDPEWLKYLDVASKIG